MPSDEPNKKMEDLLKAYATKRRAQAGPSLDVHPATRRLLHDEVKRTFPTAKGARPNRFIMRWSLGVFGSAFAVVMLTFVVLHMPNQVQSLNPATPDQGSFKSMQSASPVSADKKEAQPTTPPVNTAAVAESKPEFGGAAAPGGSVQPNAPLAIRGRGAFQRNLMPFAPAAKDRSIGGALFDTGSAQFSQNLSRNRAASEASSTSNVLSTFELSRNGQTVRIVDADGSVYDGLVLGPMSDAVTTKDVAKSVATNQVASQIEGNYAFKVVGTNRHLQQNIVFTGNVSDMPTQAPAGQGGQAVAQNEKSSQSQGQSQNQSQNAQSAQNARITGKVQVGTGKPYDIEAQTPAQ